MEGLEERLEQAYRDFGKSGLYRERAFRATPIFGFIFSDVLAAITISIANESYADNGIAVFYSPESLAAGASAYLGLSTLNELFFRPKIAGDKPRLDTLGRTVAVTGAASLSGILAEDYALAAKEGSIMMLLARAASNFYYEAEQNAPLSNMPILDRALHNICFAYPEAAAMAGGALLSLLFPGTLSSGGEFLGNGLLAATSLYAARGLIGKYLGNFFSTVYYLMDAGQGEKKYLEYAKIRLRESKTKAEAVSRLEDLAREHLNCDDVISALQCYERASHHSDSPYTLDPSNSTKLFQKNVRSGSFNYHFSQLSNNDPEVLRTGFKAALADRQFEVAEVYAERISDLIGRENPQAEGEQALVLSILKKHNETIRKLGSYIRTIIPSLEETAQTESVSESRHSVWRIDGVVPGYLRRMESAERAEAEYRNALFFYEHFAGRIPEPLPPIELGRQVYIFSRAFGEGNLLDKIRKGSAMPQDILDSVKLLIEIQNAAAPRRDLPDPLSDQGYLMRRFDTAFLEPLRTNGIEISSEQEAVLREAVYLLEPSILALPRGIYRDLNPKNIVEGPAGTKIPIDWEELVRYPIQKDAYKLLIFGDFYLPSRLYDEMVKEIIIGTHESVAPSMSFQEYREDFRRGLHLMGPAIHLDMAGYAAKDQASSANEYARRWNKDAQRFHLIFSSWIFNDLCTLANEIGIDQTSLFFDASDALTEIVETNYPGGLTYAPHIPDRRRPFFRSLFQKEERYAFYPKPAHQA